MERAELQRSTQASDEWRKVNGRREAIREKSKSPLRPKHSYSYVAYNIITLPRGRKLSPEYQPLDHV